MGDVIVLAERRRLREQNGNGAAIAAIDARPREAIFLFDLASPLTYLAAERVERLLGNRALGAGGGGGLHRGNPWSIRRRAPLPSAAPLR